MKKTQSHLKTYIMTTITSQIIKNHTTKFTKLMIPISTHINNSSSNQPNSKKSKTFDTTTYTKLIKHKHPVP